MRTLFFMALVLGPIFSNAQSCEFVGGKFQLQGAKVKESKWRKVLKTSTLENYTIKMAKLGDKKLLAMNIAVVPKFTVYNENKLAVKLANGKKVGLGAITEFKSSRASNGRQRAKVYYVISPENYTLLSNVKIKSIRVDMGPRYTDITVKPADQDQIMKQFRCLK